MRLLILITVLFSSITTYSQENTNAIVNDTLYSYNWNNNLEEWDISSRTINLYNNSNQRIETQTQIWSQINLNWENSWKTTYEYDLNGRQIKSSNYDFENNIWLKNWQNSTVFNLYGKKESYLSQVGDSSQLNWKNQSIQIYTYNQSNKEITKTVQHWESTWVNYSKDSTAYDSSGVISNAISQRWSAENIWQNSTNINYSLTTNPAVYITQVWDNNNQEWRNVALNSIEIGCDGHVSEGLTQSWDNNSDNWLNSTRYLNTYSGNLRSIVEYQRWDNTDSLWIKNYHELYSYNNSSQITERLRQNWDNNLQDWTNAMNYTYNYDESNKKIEDAILFWNNITNQWDGSSRNQYSYEGSYLAERISQIWNNNNIWENNTKVAYNYTDLSSIESILKEVNYLISNTIKHGEKIKLINNNNSNKLKIALYNLEGRILLEKTLTSTKEFTINSNIQSGIYLLMIYDKHKLLSSEKIFVY